VCYTVGLSRGDFTDLMGRAPVVPVAQLSKSRTEARDDRSASLSTFSALAYPIVCGV